MSTPWILVVAGHDPSGGAGVTADVEAAAALAVEVRAVVTAWTDQDERAVRAVGARPAGEWAAEAHVRLREHPDALKLGLLPDASSVRAAAELVEAARASSPDLPVVVDPVLASSSGFRFLDEHAVEALRSELLARGPVLTPNLPEAAELAEVELEELLESPAARIAAARVLFERGARGVVVKGGHAPGLLVRDLVLASPRDVAWIEQPRRSGPGQHGTGCRHASALAAGLARKRSLLAAARDAALYVGGRIASGPIPS